MYKKIAGNVLFVITILSVAFGTTLFAQAQTTANPLPLVKANPAFIPAISSGSAVYYKFTLSTSTNNSNLTITTYGVSGDVDIYLNKDTIRSNSASTWKSQRRSSSVESISISAPVAGTYYLKVYAYTKSASTTINLNYGPSTVPSNVLTITTSGTGTGLVTSSPSGINCGVTCSATFATGTVVGLTAIPTTGQTFAGWTGACSGVGTCTVTMSAVKTVGAIFNTPVVATTTPATTPTITRVNMATPSTYTAQPGSQVTITLNWDRVPMSANYLQFMHLDSGRNIASVDDHNVSSATWNGSSPDPRIITVPATLPVGVYDIKVGLSGGNPWTDISLAMGTGVTNPGNTNAYKVGTITIATSTPLPIPQNTLTVTTSGTGSGSITSSPSGISCGATCSATFATGTVVTLTASPTGANTFSGWTGACAGTSTCTVTLNTAKSVVGTFTAPVVVVATSTKFTLNQRVAVSSGPLNVRATANGTLLGTQATGALGTVTGGPIFTSTYWWWSINFDSGVSGWVAEDFVGATSTQATSTAGIPSGVGPRGGVLTVSGPITVTQGQTVSGLKISNLNGPCITVIGSNVRITNNEIGPCGTVTKADMDVGILINEKLTNVTIDHNYIHDARAGVYAYNASSSIIIEKNYFKNVFGGIPRGQYIQFNGVSGTGNKIRCNVGEQDPFNQGVAKEDSFSIYNSSGTVASPIEVAYNKLRGGSSPTGCGIMTGEENSAYINVHHNNVIHPGVCGIAIAGGKNITQTNNKIYSDEGAGPGMYVWEWTETGRVCTNHTVTNNTINWVSGGGNDFWNAGNCTNVNTTGNVFGANIGAEIWNESFAECATISP